MMCSFLALVQSYLFYCTTDTMMKYVLQVKGHSARHHNLTFLFEMSAPEAFRDWNLVHSIGPLWLQEDLSTDLFSDQLLC